MRTRTRPEEPGGEVYGEDRLDRLEQRIAELRDEGSDENGASDPPTQLMKWPAASAAAEIIVALSNDENRSVENGASPAPTARTVTG
jgi:hypothetical protein